MTRRFSPRRRACSIPPIHRRRRQRFSPAIVVIVILAQSVALVGWETPIIIAIVGAPAVLLRPTRASYPIHA